jgi:MFS family permease
MVEFAKRERGETVVASHFRLNLVTSFFGNLVAPVFSLFIPILAVNVGATPFEVGVVGGAASIVYAFMPFVVGHLSDRGGARRFFVLSSFVLLTIVSAFYSVASTPLELIIARACEGLGWALLWPAIESGITLETFGNSKALSYFNSSWSLGAAIGPLLGGFLIAFSSMRLAYIATTVVLAFTLVANLVSLIVSRGEIQIKRKAVEKYSFASSLKGVFQWNDPKKNFQTMLYVASLILSYVSDGIIFTFFGPYGKTLGMTVLLIAAPPFVFGLLRFVTYAISTREGVRRVLLNPSTRNRNVIVALFAASVSSLLVTIRDPSGVLYFVAFSIFACGFSVVYFIAQMGMIGEANESSMGSGAGVFESSIGVGLSIGPIIAGVVATGSYVEAFLVPPVGFALVVIFLLVFGKARRVL